MVPSIDEKKAGEVLENTQRARNGRHTLYVA
jgi:hypothetical protein